MSKHLKESYEYLNNTEWSAIESGLKNEVSADELQALRISHKIANQVTESEFCDPDLSPDVIAVKLSSQEMELIRGGYWPWVKEVIDKFEEYRRKLIA